MKKKIKAGVTIEAAVVIPISLFVFVVLIHVLFYYHDKNILMGIAHETAALGCQREEVREEDLEKYMGECARNRLLAFKEIKQDVHLDQEQISITCTTSTERMHMTVEYKMSKTKPERYIRNIRKLERIQKENKGE